MATNTLPRQQAGSWLDEMIDVRRINAEVVAYILVIALSVVAHLWGLGVMAMHHDESVHAYPTWSLYQGRGGFTCYNGESSPVYCYDPVYHGPSLYFLMLSSYFLFGAGEFQARLPMALAGIGLVASCIMLRPYLGRGGALLAAVLLGFAPSLLYYTRFARHDGLMILWELWMVIGFLRYLDTGRRGWLYLLATAIGLAIGTHELYYILFFIFGMFAIIRAIDESRWSNRLTMGLLVALGVCFVLMLVNPPLPVGKGLYLGDKAMLIATALAMGLLVRRVWDPTPVLLPRLRSLWQDDRRTLWTALALLGVVYVLQYSSFFAYPRGIIDGLYAGLAYWLGSQHEYARGDQPWYYYLMLLPIYEPLALFGSLVTGVLLLARRLVFGEHPGAEVASSAVSPITPAQPAPATEGADAGELAEAKLLDGEDDSNALVRAKRELATGEGRIAVPPPLVSEPQPVAVAAPFVAQRPVPLNPVPLAAALLVFWFANALMDFSWAGEKMPWLVVHMSLPGNLLVAWALARLGAWGLGREEGEGPEAEQRRRMAITLIPGLVVLLVILLGVALWRLGDINPDQAGQRNLLGGLVQLLLAGGTLYGLLSLGTRYGYRALIALATLTVAGITGAYMLRATWLVVYDHPDTPIEPLIYVQTTPGIPLLVEDIRELAINQTRTQRSTDDITGGLSMPIIIDSGDPQSDGEGSLAWPLQWYFRDFTRINWRSTDTFRTTPGPNSFDVTDAQGQTGPAPVVLLYKPHVTQQVREALEQGYVQRYQNAKLNWWFPEGDKCSPDKPGYKRFYFNSWTDPNVLQGPGPKGCGPTADPATFPAPWAPLLHPFQRENWGMVTKYLLFRSIPDDLNLGAREMEVWVRKDLVPASEGVVGGGATGGSGLLRLVAEQQIGAPGSGEGQLSLPTGIAVGPNGAIYVADTLNHRIQVFNADGSFLRSIGSRGNGEGQFLEPRGLAVDKDGTLYVADTWNARIVKLSPEGQVLATWGSGAQELGEGKRATITEGTAEGNAANPLGFFGPRGLALDGKGNLYIADTGNKRIVVTSTEGEFRFQWGVGGADRGSFNEPTAVAIDKAGLVYVADTWNGRVQVFQPGPDGQIDPVPAFLWSVRGWQPNTYDDPALTVGPDGQVYVSVPASQSVLLANQRGVVALRWGGPGSDLASLNGPSGMAATSDGSLYVVDRADGRVLRFRLPALRLEEGE